MDRVTDEEAARASIGGKEAAVSSRVEEETLSTCEEEASSSDSVLMQGHLWKRSMYMKRWNKRYFELTDNCLRYKASEKKAGTYRGVVPASTWRTVGLLPKLKAHENWTGFYIHTSDDSIALASETLEDAQHWVSCLERVRAGGEKKETSGLGVEEVVVLSPGSPAADATPTVTMKHRPSFSLPSFRPRSQTLVDQQVDKDADEQFTLVSGMLEDIIKKKDSALHEMEELIGEKDAALREMEDRNEELEKLNEDLKAQLAASREQNEELSAQIDKAIMQLNERTRMHGDLELEHLKLQDQVESVQTALTTPFWKSPKKKSPTKKGKRK